jgi:hypothetical protein
MAYTASALSFMLEDLGKTVVSPKYRMSCFPTITTTIDINRGPNTTIAT